MLADIGGVSHQRRPNKSADVTSLGGASSKDDGHGPADSIDEIIRGVDGLPLLQLFDGERWVGLWNGISGDDLDRAISCEQDAWDWTGCDEKGEESGQEEEGSHCVGCVRLMLSCLKLLVCCSLPASTLVVVYQAGIAKVLST